MSHIATVRLWARDPPAFQSVNSRSKLAAPVYGQAKSTVGVKTGCVVKLTKCWSYNPLLHSGSPILEIRRPDYGFTSSSR